MSCPVGHPNEDGARYCSTCGAHLSTQAATVARTRSGSAYLRWLLPLLAVAGVGGVSTVLLAMYPIGGDVSKAETETAATNTDLPERLLPLAFDRCDADDVTEVITLADEGHTVIADTGSELGDFYPIECLFAELKTSSALTSQMSSTTAMMGVQEASEGALTYKWSYHPDNGLNLIITESENSQSG